MDRLGMHVPLVVVLGIIIAGLLLGGAGNASGQAPQRIEIAPEPACTGCEIVVTRVATLSDPRDSVLLTPRSQPVRDSRGRFYAWSATRGTIAVFDSSGSFLRTLGRLGSGPAEFPAPGAPMLIGPGDSLWVFETRAFRVWTPSHSYGRRLMTPGALMGKALLLPAGGMVYPASLGTGDRAGLPLHRLSANGELLNSFGADGRAPDPGCSACRFRALGLARESGTIWSALTNAYQIEKWTLEGRLLATITAPRSSWLPAAMGNLQRAGQRDPRGKTASISGIWEDTDGRIWVLGFAGRGEGDEEPSSGPRIARRPNQGVPEVTGTTIIEVIDPGTRRVVASRAFERAAYSHMANDLLFRRREDADGYVYIDVYRVALAIPHPSPHLPARTPPSPPPYSRPPRR